MKNKLSSLSMIAIMSLSVGTSLLTGVWTGVSAGEINMNLQEPKISPNSIEINVNKNKINSDLIKLITLEGVTSTESAANITINKNDLAKYLISGDDKFAQGNITAAYSDYTKAVAASLNNDFQAMFLAYKLANIGFFTLSQHAINQISDTAMYSSQTQSIKNIFFPTIALSYDEEILLAEKYADIYYNNLSKETIKELSKSSNLLKKSDYANYILSQAYYESGDFGRAMNTVNKALNIHKNSPFYLQYKSKILCETKNYNDAIKILDKIPTTGFLIQKFQKGLDVQREYTLSNQYKEASKSKFHLARYFYLIGENNRALKEINNSISAKKKNAEALAMLGDIQFKIGDYTKAKDAYEKALKVNKKNSQGLMGLGNLEKLTGTYEQALVYYKQAQKHDKNNLDAAIETARLLNKTGDSVKAKEIFAAEVIKHPNSSKLYYAMSEVYDEKQSEYLKKSLSLNVFNSDAWIDLAEISVTHNNLEQAEKYLLWVKASDNENYKYYYVEGLVNKLKSNETAAVTSFKKSLKLNPNYTPAEKQLNTLNL